MNKVIIVGVLLAIVFACSDGRADELEELEEQTSLMQEQAWNQRYQRFEQERQHNWDNYERSLQAQRLEQQLRNQNLQNVMRFYDYAPR
jgi:hypothetical protein